MDKLKKYGIKSIAFVMAVLFLVMTPLSDYADTQGIGDTHASAGTAILTAGAVVSLGLLAYNVVVPEENEIAIVNDVLNHIGNHFSSTAEDIAKLKAGAVQWVFNATFLEGVKHYLESKIGNLDTPQTVGVSGSGRLYFDTLPISETRKAKLKALNISLCNDIDSKLSGFQGFYNDLWTSASFVTRDTSFFPIDISSYDACYYSGSTLMFYNFGDIANAVSLSSLAYGSDGLDMTHYSSEPWKINYHDECTSFSLTTWGEYLEKYPTATLKSFSNYNYYGSENLPMSGQPYYCGSPFLYSSSKSNALSGIYTTYPNLVGGSDSEVATSYGGYDVANPNTLVGAVITQEIANAILDSTRTDIQEKANDTSLAPKDLSDSINGLVAQSFLDNLLNYEEVLPPSVEDNDGVLDKYKEEIQYGDGVVSTAPTDITVGEQAIIDQSVTNANGIIGALNKVILGITTVISSIVDLPARIAEAFTSALTSIRNAVLSVAKSVWDYFADSITSIKESVKTIADSKTDTETDTGTDTDTGLLSGVKDVLTDVFVPDTEVLWEAVTMTFEKYAFTETLLTVAEDIGAKVSNINGPPVIYIDFSESEDERYQSIGKLVAVDFAWYERYKPYGDSIISAVLWVFFILRLLRGAPSIFKGLQTGNEVGIVPTVTPFNVPQIERK